MNAEERIALEARVLSELCAATRDDARAGVARIKGYSWSGADAAAMYSAIGSAVARNAGLDRETLTAIATREGFPDLNWAGVFALTAPGDRGGLASLVAQLLSK